MKVAIIGIGFVGSAVLAASDACSEICTYDKFCPDRTQNWNRAPFTDLCFVCVPTPTDKAGQDLEAVTDALNHLRGMSTEGYKGVVVIKSTVLPGTTAWLQEQFPDLRLVHYPEFLCEKTAVNDFANQKTILLSGKIENTRVARIYADLCLNIERAQYSEVFADTEWAKYIHNCILPVKLSFLNEVYDLIGNDRCFNEAVEMATWFGNVGGHSMVPGPDGQRGWGGACFTKDTKALEMFASSQGLKMDTLTGAISTNLRVRYNGKEQNNG